MRRTFILLAFLFLIISTASAATISGIVVDVNSNPIAGMPVESYSASSPCCSDPTSSTVADANGMFSIESGKIILVRPANTQYAALLTPTGTTFPAGYYKITYSVVEAGSKMESETPPEKQGKITKFKDDHPQASAGIAAGIVAATLTIAAILIGLVVTATAPAWGAVLLAGLAVGAIFGLLTSVVFGIGDPNTASHQAIQFFTDAVADAAEGGGIMPDTEQVKEWFIEFMQILVGDKAAKTVGWIHFSTIFILTFIAVQFIQKEADI